MKSYTLLQLPSTHPALFGGYQRNKKYNVKVDLDDYVPTYTDTIEELDDDAKSDLAICEDLFTLFNIDRPANFAGHSMCVADVILIDNGKGDKRFYYCDIVGFLRLNPITFEEIAEGV